MRAKWLLALFIFGICGIGSAEVEAADIKITTKGDTFAFDVTEIHAKPQQKVKVTFKNSASKTSGLQHNWVLVKPGTADTVANASVEAGPQSNWLKESPDVLAHTKLISPGEEDTVTFSAPKMKGDYPYICTFPGHSATMKGQLHVH